MAQPLFCSQCGASVHPDTRFCVTCGNPIASTAAVEAAAARVTEIPAAKADHRQLTPRRGAAPGEILAWFGVHILGYLASLAINPALIGFFRDREIALTGPSVPPWPSRLCRRDRAVCVAVTVPSVSA